MAQNGSTTFSVSVSPSNGFSSPVGLSVSGLPAGVSASFTPATLSYPYSSAATLTLTPSGATPIATSGFTVTGSGGGLNRSAGASLTVTNLQPTSLTFNVPQGYAGSDSYTVTVGAGQNILLDIRYTLNGNTVPDQSIQLDASGQYFHALTHSDAPGLYDFTHFKNAQNAEWIAFPAGGHPQYTVYPPQPQNLTVTPSSFDLPGTYAMTAANGADVAMDFIYSFQPQGGTEGPDITHVPLGWPVLAPISPGSPDGTADIIATVCTPPGVYRYKKIRNTLNSAWVDLPGPVTSTVTSALVLDSTSNVGAQAGTSVSVTLQGEFLCDLDLSTTYPGLTIADPAYGTPPQDPEGTLATALFTVAPGTGPGIAEITVTGPAGEATFNFGIGTGSAPTVTAISPNARPAGSNATVTIFGTSLIGAELETTTPGVSFSDYDWAPSGTSMTATFMIDITAQQGTVPINVTTTAGTVATSLFSIGDPQPALTREYIYLGGRVIAVESQ